MMNHKQTQTIRALRNRFRWTLAGWILLTLVGGCSHSAETPLVEQEVQQVGFQGAKNDPLNTPDALQLLAAVKQPATPVGKKEPQPVKEEDGEEEEVEVEELTVIERKLQGLELPFPARDDPFQQPTVERSTAGLADSRQASSEAVVLRGFVNVDGRRALLEIKQNLLAFKEGEEKEGIKVVEIQPPMVTLQRGRVRWQESLETERR